MFTLELYDSVAVHFYLEVPDCSMVKTMRVCSLLQNQSTLRPVMTLRFELFNDSVCHINRRVGNKENNVK